MPQRIDHLERDRKVKSECGAVKVKVHEGGQERDFGAAGTAEEEENGNSPGPVALPDRLVSRRRPLEGEGTRMAARKARDRRK